MRLPIFAHSGPREWIVVALAAAVLVALPLWLNDPFFILVLQSLAYLFIATLGLDILVGWTGQISLGHAGLYAVGAYTSALLATKAGMPFWISAPIGVVVAGLFGVILALPALRAKGPYLAMVTLAFGFMIEVLSNRVAFTGGPMGIAAIPAPTFPDGTEMTPIQYFWLIGFVALLCLLLVSNLLRSRIGRTLLALQGSEIAAETVGINVYRYKVLSFVISSVLCGIGGVFFAHQNGFINSDTFVFSLSVSFLTSVLMGGSGTLYGPLVGSVVLNLIPTIFASIHDYHLYIYGGIILVTIIFLPKGIVGSLRQYPPFRDWKKTPLSVEPDRSVLNLGRELAVSSKPVLEVRGLAKNFGGVRALGGVDVSIAPSTVHGLIGPNGSGKSTFVNVVTGVYRPDGGEILIDGQATPAQSPHGMAELGITRTFQTIRLFTSLSALQNVMVGFHLQLRHGFFSHLLQTRGAVDEEAAFQRKAMALLELVGLADRAHELASNLSYGQQRLLEIARGLATRPRLMMLDEPAAGLNPTELQHIARIIGDIKKAGVTLLVIEHHMELIMGISDRISVLDFGQKIADGVVDEIKQNPKVIEAYLGTPLEPGSEEPIRA